MTRHKRHRIKLRSMYQWHRYVGIAIALFVIHLSISGILLNHTHELELDRDYVQSGWILDLYGINLPKKISSMNAGNNWLSQWNSMLFFNNNLLGSFPGKLSGVVKVRSMFVVAMTDRLLLLSPEGQVLEQLKEEHDIPHNIRAIGKTSEHQLVVMSEKTPYYSDDDMLQWSPTDNTEIQWSSEATLPGVRYQTLEKKYRGNTLTTERVIQDLHSGRILHIPGIYFMDIIGILLIFMAASGLWIWGIRIYKSRQRGK